MRQKQIDESRRLIMDGFFLILKDNKYSKISMSEIAEVSMVTRMTLYRHFKSKDQILKYLIMNLIEDIKTDFSQLEHKNLASLIKVRNQKISDSKYLKVALSNKEAEPIVREFIKLGRSMFSTSTDKPYGQNKFMFEFIIGGIENITTKWILDGMKESPDTITKETLSVLIMMNIDLEETV